MHIKTTLSALTLMAAIGSCGTSEEPTEVSAPSKIDPSAITTPSVDPTVPVENLNGNMALNPPHGEPGHRCEIPVGAPLDGSGGTAPAPGAIDLSTTIQSGSGSPIQVQPATTTPTTTGSGRINPPHGEPGHDCAVPVGQELP